MDVNGFELKHRLKAVGLRPTRQRLHIANLLFRQGDRHLTAEMLYAEAKNTRYPPSWPPSTMRCAISRPADLFGNRPYGSRAPGTTPNRPHFHYISSRSGTVVRHPEEHVPNLNVPGPARHADRRRRRRDPAPS